MYRKKLFEKYLTCLLGILINQCSIQIKFTLISLVLSRGKGGRAERLPLKFFIFSKPYFEVYHLKKFFQVSLIICLLRIQWLLFQVFQAALNFEYFSNNFLGADGPCRFFLSLLRIIILFKVLIQICKECLDFLF